MDQMKKPASAKNMLIATVIASVAGTGAWLLGFSEAVLHGHAMLVTFILTVFTYLLLKESLH